MNVPLHETGLTESNRTVHIPGELNLPPGISHELAWQIGYHRTAVDPALFRQTGRSFNSIKPAGVQNKISYKPLPITIGGGLGVGKLGLVAKKIEAARKAQQYGGAGKGKVGRKSGDGSGNRNGNGGKAGPKAWDVPEEVNDFKGGWTVNDLPPGAQRRIEKDYEDTVMAGETSKYIGRPEVSRAAEPSTQYALDVPMAVYDRIQGWSNQPSSQKARGQRKQSALGDIKSFATRPSVVDIRRPFQELTFQLPPVNQIDDTLYSTYGKIRDKYDGQVPEQHLRYVTDVVVTPKTPPRPFCPSTSQAYPTTQTPPPRNGYESSAKIPCSVREVLPRPQHTPRPIVIPDYALVNKLPIPPPPRQPTPPPQRHETWQEHTAEAFASPFQPHQPTQPYPQRYPVPTTETDPDVLSVVQCAQEGVKSPPRHQDRPFYGPDVETVPNAVPLPPPISQPLVSIEIPDALQSVKMGLLDSRLKGKSSGGGVDSGYTSLNASVSDLTGWDRMIMPPRTPSDSSSILLPMVKPPSGRWRQNGGGGGVTSTKAPSIRSCYQADFGVFGGVDLTVVAEETRAGTPFRSSSMALPRWAMPVSKNEAGKSGLDHIGSFLNGLSPTSNYSNR
ncbi:hypothetical protein HDV00_010276 [Rhizophlyctis rosea]|nr:hypothetical protein HDV00_010276 [Rhizophlyctis rosea]